MPKVTSRKEKSSHKGKSLLQYSPLSLQQAIYTYQEEEVTETGRKKRGYKVGLN